MVLPERHSGMLPLADVLELKTVVLREAGEDGAALIRHYEAVMASLCATMHADGKLPDDLRAFLASADARQD